MAFGGGLNSSSGGELKLYLRCTGSTFDVLIYGNNLTTIFKPFTHKIRCKVGKNTVADPGFSKWGGAVLSQMGGRTSCFQVKSA